MIKLPKIKIKKKQKNVVDIPKEQKIKLKQKLNLFNIFRRKKDVDSIDKNLKRLQKEVNKKPNSVF